MAQIPVSPRTTTLTLGAASFGPFLVGFRLTDPALSVTVDGTPRFDFSLSATFTDGFADSASLLFSTMLPAGSVLVIDGDQQIERGKDLVVGDPRLVDQINIEQSRIWAGMQQLGRDTRRAGEILTTFHQDVIETRQNALDAKAAYQMAKDVANWHPRVLNGFAALAAVSATDVPIGGQAWIIAANAMYERVSSGQDLDYSGSGGVKWKILPDAENGYSPLAWGAVGNDVADDKDPLLAWAAKLKAVGAATNSVVKGIVSAGKIFLTSSTILLGSNVILTGGGTLAAHASLPSTSLLLASEVRTAGLNAYANKNVTLDGITLDGKNRTLPEVAATQNLYRLESVEDLRVVNCTFKNHKRGLGVVMGCKGITVSGNTHLNWGFLAPTDLTGDGGSGLFVGKNYTDETDSSIITITGNTFRDGRWTALSCYGHSGTISGNVIRNCDECGIFIRSDAGGGLCSFLTVTGNTINGVRTRYIDAAGIVASGIGCVFEGNTIHDCDAAGISIGEGAQGVDVVGNRVTNCVRRADLTGFASLGQITLRNSSAALDPANVRIIGNTVKDLAGTRLAPRGIAVYQATGTLTAIHGIEISNNYVYQAAVLAADNVYVQSGILGNFCGVGNNPGSVETSGVQHQTIIFKGAGTYDIGSVAANSALNFDIVVSSAFALSVNDRVLLGLPANGFANGLSIKSFVLDATTIRLQVLNVTGAAIDPASSFLTYSIMR